MKDPMIESVPAHLRKYVVEQDYSRYTPVDQAAWRYVMRQLRHFLAEHAHPCYAGGLAKTGISVERIPVIAEMSEKMEKFGWRAVPVSGFLPPAAFMELQSLGFLPIACDMRSINHLLYTPAPDIVHEAAGHAPILVDPEFASYLKKYAQAARMAILSRDDLNQYEAIRSLSDLKEDRDSTAQQIADAEARVHEVTASMRYVSEAARLGRMNWWTAEYGLIGSLENPRIFGAGLLSSVAESRACLRAEVRKIPLTIECVEQSYDITEQQPQLFVAPDFARLGDVLEDLAKTMAYRVGGRAGLSEAVRSETTCTAELDSALQISGVIKHFLVDDSIAAVESGGVAYLQFEGPTQLAFDCHQILGHGAEAHPHGFGSPVGPLATGSLDDLAIERRAKLEFKSGVVVDGHVVGWTRAPDGALAIVSFVDCAVRRGEQVLFMPEWGTYDMAVGLCVRSVFGGPADRELHAGADRFVARRLPPRLASVEKQNRHALYAQLRSLRQTPDASRGHLTAELAKLLRQIAADPASGWLAHLEAIEIASTLPDGAPIALKARATLSAIAQARPELAGQIEDGLRLVSIA